MKLPERQYLYEIEVALVRGEQARPWQSPEEGFYRGTNLTKPKRHFASSTTDPYVLEPGAGEVVYPGKKMFK